MFSIVMLSFYQYEITFYVQGFCMCLDIFLVFEVFGNVGRTIFRLYNFSLLKVFDFLPDYS